MNHKINDYKNLSIDDVLSEFMTDKNGGLTKHEAEKRFKKYGPNEIPEKEESTFHRIFRRFWGPIPWMIEIAAILSAAVGKWDDFIIIMTLLFVNAGLDFWQESKALSALKVLKNKLAHKATVLRDGIYKTIDSSLLVPGDIIKIKIGEIIPADVKLLDGEYLQIDQAALTGESLPVTKNVSDIAYANAVVKKGEMIAVILATGLNTFFGKTVALVAKAEKEQKSHFQKMVMQVGNYLITITLIMAAIILLSAFYRHENMLNIIRFTLVLTVAAIPVALPAVLTVTIAVGAMRLAKLKAIVSRLAAIEEIAGIDILCSDKTGTLTKNKMTIDKPVLIGNYSEDELMLYAGMASKEENNDPIEIPIYDYLKSKGIYEKLSDFKQEKFKPFDPVIKRTEAIINSQDGTFTVIKGAPQVILELCKNIEAETILKPVNDLAKKGYRTIGVAIKKDSDETFNYIGLIPLFDPPRDDARETLKEAEELGLSIKMITGDNVAIAKQISAKLGLGTKILESKKLLGSGGHEEFLILTKILSKAIFNKLDSKISEEKLDSLAAEITDEVEKQISVTVLPKGTIKSHESEIIEIIENADGFAQVFPEDKYIIVDKLQKKGHIIGMTGDGVNDAPALKKADAGIAVSGATDAARAAADLILLTPGISVIIDAIKESRIIFERMKSYAIYRIAETIRIVLFMTLAILVFNFYPVTAIMIILLALLNDIPILSIAYDNTRIDKKPVKWNKSELFGLSTLLGSAGVVSSFVVFFILEKYTSLSQETIQSIIFVKLIIAGHLTIYNTRTNDWFFKKPYPSSILFWSSFSTAVLGTLFGVYGILIPAIGWVWGILVWLLAGFFFLFNDTLKVFYYRNILNENKLLGLHIHRQHINKRL